jgi:hypothetical protein
MTRVCQCPGCDVVLANMRPQAKFCSPRHRALASRLRRGLAPVNEEMVAEERASEMLWSRIGRRLRQRPKRRD